MKTLLVVAILLVPASGLAQDQRSRSPSRRTVLPTQNPAAAQRPAPAKAAPAQLSENVVLHWEGSFQGMLDLDFHLTGCGPEFRSEFNIPGTVEEGMPPSIFTIRATVNQSGERFHVEYSIGARIAIKAGSSHPNAKGPVTHNIEFRDLLTSGAVILKLGEPLILSKVNGKTLSVGISAAK